MISGISKDNRKILDDINRHMKGPFSAKDVSEILSLPLQKSSILLTYFVKKGWLSRVRRGLYITVPLGTINPKEYKENPFIVANRIFSPCYIGGWSASEHWEYTDQIFNSIVVITSKKFRKKSVKIHGSDYVLRYLQNKYYDACKITAIWINNQKINFSDPVQTIVDILDDPMIGGGMRSVADIITSYFLSEYRNDEKIFEYIEARNNKTIYKRLGYLIDTLKINASNVSKQCKERISTGFTMLDTSAESKGSFNTMWNLRINVNIEK